MKDKNSEKIDKLKTTFHNILNSKLGEIESEAFGQIKEAKIKEEMALKNLQEKTDTLKQEYLSVHEHEKIVNEKLDYYNKGKSIEMDSLTEKFEQELRHLKETFSMKYSFTKLKYNGEKQKHKTRVEDLMNKIENLGESKYLMFIESEIEALKNKDTEIYQYKQDLKTAHTKTKAIKDRLHETENELQSTQKAKGSHTLLII
jgi:hypothetical protein